MMSEEIKEKLFSDLVLINLDEEKFLLCFILFIIAHFPKSLKNLIKDSLRHKFMRLRERAQLGRKNFLCEASENAVRGRTKSFRILMSTEEKSLNGALLKYLPQTLSRNSIVLFAWQNFNKQFNEIMGACSLFQELEAASHVGGLLG